MRSSTVENRNVFYHLRYPRILEVPDHERSPMSFNAHGLEPETFQFLFAQGEHVTMRGTHHAQKNSPLCCLLFFSLYRISWELWFNPIKSSKVFLGTTRVFRSREHTHTTPNESHLPYLPFWAWNWCDGDLWQPRVSFAWFEHDL